MKKYFFISFLTPILILGVVFLILGLLNGEMSIVISDLYTQYDKLFKSLKNNFDLDFYFYSFYKGLGGSMISTFAYYLLSPFNLLLLFFDNIYNFIISIIFLKIGFAGLTSYSYLKYNFKSFDNLILCVFSSCYALSLYVCAYYFNVMWLDAVLLAPLVLLGIDKLIDQNKWWIFCVSLFALIISNYYMAFLTCIFAAIYFFYKCILKNILKKNIIKFSIISILVFLTTLFIHLPNIVYMLNSVRQQISDVSIFNLNISETIGKLFIGSQTNDNLLNPNSFYLYSGLLVLVLVVLYFFNTKIIKKEKLLSSLVYLIMLLSILLSPLNNVWHMFTQTNMFNGRYMFLFVLFNIYIAIKSFINIKSIKVNDYIKTIILVSVLIVVAIIFKEIGLILGIVNFVLILIYIIILKNYNNVFKILLIIMVLLEIYFNSFLMFQSYEFDYYNSYSGLYEDKKLLLEQLSNYEHEPFYRTSLLVEQDLNVSFEYNFYSPTHWLSTNNFNNQSYEKLGLEKTKNGYVHYSIPTTDSILGIKYIVSLDELSFHKLIDQVEINASGFFYDKVSYEYNIYENENYLSIGFMTDKSINDFTQNNFINQNELMKSMTSLDLNIFKDYEKTAHNTFIIGDENDFYIDFNIDVLKSEDVLKYKILVNEQLIDIATTKTNSVLVNNTYNIGDEIKVQFETITGNCEIDDIIISSFDKDIYLKHIAILSDEQFLVKNINDGYLNGEINVINDGVFFTSIPYEDGWNIYVDGKKVEYYKNLGSFIAFDLQEGFHEIEMKYYPPYLNTGIAISIASLSCLCVYWYYNKKKAINHCN